MTDRNDPCPCGSGKKFKKCHGAAGAEAPAAASAQPAPAARSSAEEEKPFLVHTGRGVDAERSESERKKHLRKRIQTGELRGTLVYNSGAFFRPPNPS